MVTYKEFQLANLFLSDTAEAMWKEARETGQEAPLGSHDLAALIFNAAHPMIHQFPFWSVKKGLAQAADMYMYSESLMQDMRRGELNTELERRLTEAFEDTASG